jgi:hypothetical protein
LAAKGAAAEPHFATSFVSEQTFEAIENGGGTAAELGPPQSEPPRSRSSQGGQLLVAIMTIWLFLLACGYAGYAGLMHSRNDSTAWLGLAGAFISLAVAGVGVCITACPSSARQSRHFLALLTIFLTGVYLILVICGMGR